MNQSSNFSENWGTVLNWNGEKLRSEDNLYANDVNGNLSKLLQNEPIYGAYFLSSLATADEGYIILYNSSHPSSLNAIFIDYNKTSTSNSILINVPIDLNTTINAVHCDAYFGFGHYCIASISKQTNESYYEFLFYTGKLIGSNQLHQLPNNISVSWNVSSTPIGGYIFSAVVNATCFIYIYDVDHYFNNSK
ncbi:44628_t:CDS:2, partial [Gigaspora margarita]